jgi:hypothetical protein
VNRDGIPDFSGYYGYDRNPYHTDYNANGVPDRYEDGYGFASPDANGDGVPDMYYNPYAAVDYNMDGKADHYGFNYTDKNRDGLPDGYTYNGLGFDGNGDGIPDANYNYNYAVYSDPTGTAYNPFGYTSYSYPNAYTPAYNANEKAYMNAKIPEHTNMLNYLNTNPAVGYGAGSGMQYAYGSAGFDPYFSSMHYYHKCSPKCSMAPGFCTGRTASDCIRCANHASEDATGACVCDPFWSGSDCSVRSSYATCH